MEQRQWWFDARNVGDNDPAISVVNQSSAGGLLVTPEQQGRVADGKQAIVWVERPEQLDQLRDGAWVLTPSKDILHKAMQSGRKGGLFVEVRDLQKEFPYCEEVVKRGYDFVAIDMYHATYIPFELLVALIKDSHTRLFRTVPIKDLEGTVDYVNQSLNAFATLESGVDVLLGSSKVEDIQQFEQQVFLRGPGKIELLPAKVVEVQHCRLGHRVCVDTTTMMTQEEGMLLGTTGHGGIFVCSETHYLPHMNLREWRCNAGSVQSYIWGPNDRAVYLSELRAGSEVLAVDIHGNYRVVTVGRVKIERRPMLLIVCECEWQGKTTTIKHFLQNDWHVRIMGADHKVRHSTLVKVGDHLLAHADVPGRHTGLKVYETIDEK